MSISIQVFYSEKPEEKYTIEQTGKSFKSFILSSERFTELSENFKDKFMSLTETDLDPYISMEITISGVGWHPYVAPSWDRYGGDPGESAGYDDFKLDDYDIGPDSEKNIFETFSNQNIVMTENDKSILKDILIGAQLFPTANAPFASITIDDDGSYELNVSNDFENSGFEEWVTNDDLADLDEDEPEPDFDDDPEPDDTYCGPYDPWN